MKSANFPEELLSLWQRLYEEGRDLPVAELCRDCPELASEMERRINALKQVERLAQAANSTSGSPQTLPQAALPATLPGPLAAPGYEILGELGRGGMGVVYKARHLALKRLVALKMVLTGIHADPSELRRFRAEAEAVARFQHVGIVQIYDVGECNGLPYCAFEFVDGGSLADRLALGVLPPHEAARIVEQLARAVHYAHQRNVIHRDLKPANVLLTQDGQPKVTDFGLAKQLDLDRGQTRSGQVLGTPGYMAPEQVEGPPGSVGPATDVYALGAILYECLTGRPPFQGETVMATLIQVLSEAPEPPHQHNPNVPAELEAICLRCLRKPAADRFPTALELAEALHSCAAGSKTGGHAGAEPLRVRRGRRWLWPVMVTALLAGPAVGYWLATLNPGEPELPAAERVAAARLPEKPLPQTPANSQSKKPRVEKNPPVAKKTDTPPVIPKARVDWSGAPLDLVFSQDARCMQGVVRELRLRPNVRMQWFLHIRNDTDQSGKLKVVLFAGKEPVPGASVEVEVAKQGITPVIFGKAAPSRDGKPTALPLTEIKAPLSVRLFDMKGNVINNAQAPISVASPREYVTVDAVTFAPGVSADGKKNVLEVKLSAHPNFVGPPARVELILSPERIPNLLPGQRKEGTYGGLLRPGAPLVLRAENLRFRETAELKQGLFHVIIDGYPRAFSFVSSFTGEMGTQQPRAITGPMLRLVHPAFVKPGTKLPVVVEVDNMPAAEVCTLAMFRNKLLAPASREGETLVFTGNRAEIVLLNPKGLEGGLVLEAKVGDHSAEFDTKDIYGVRYLATGMMTRAPGEAIGRNREAYLNVLDSKRIPEVGLDPVKAGKNRIVETVLMHEDSPEVVNYDLDLAPPKPGKRLQLRAGVPLPLKASCNDPTGIVKVIFFLGQPLPGGRIPEAAAQVEGVQRPAQPGVWTAAIELPFEKRKSVPVSVQATNGVGLMTTRTLIIHVVDRKNPNFVPPAAGKETKHVSLEIIGSP